MQQSAGDGEVKKKIHRASLLLMASILISRLIGFFREWVLAQTVGANALTDVYYASFTVPDLLNHLMAAGALSISFIPILSAMVTAGETEKGQRAFRFLSGVMGALVVALVIVGEIFARPLAELVAPGFTPDQLDLLAFLIRIILPAQIFFYWGGMAVAVQHTHGHFLFPAIAPIIYNLGIIVFGLLMQKSHGVVGFSVGVLAGSFVGHGLLQWWGLRRLGYSVLPYLRFDRETLPVLKRYIWLSIPIMVGFSIVVADEWFGKYFASYLEGSAVSWLQYARIEMRIPVSVIGQAAGVASFPYLARLWSAGNFVQYGKTLMREIQKLWAASLLAAVVFVVHALPITHFIYGGGKFTSTDLQITASVLRYFGVGIFFLTVQGLLSRGFYACQRTWMPSVIGTVVSILTVPLYHRMAQVMGVQGLGLSGSIAFAVYAIVLGFLLRSHLKRHCPELEMKKFYLFAVAWLGVAAVLGVLSYGILEMGIYRGDRWTALADVAVTVTVVTGLGILALRKIFPRLTDGPLF